jgi:type IV pilus assembly protein PilM
MADKKSIVTLDIGSQRVTLAKFSITKGNLILQDYAFQDIVGDPALDAARSSQVSQAIASLTSQLRLQGQDVYYTISGHSVFTRFVSLPDIDVDLDQMVLLEAQQNVPFPIDEVTWAYQRVSSGGEGEEVEILLVAIKNDAIEELNDAVEGGKLIGRGVDVAPVALSNAFKYNYPDVVASNASSLLIDVGARTSDLIYIQGDRIFTRSIQVGGAAVTSAIAKEFDLDFAEAEDMKLQSGMVSLGGSFEDPEDPTIAAMSKVIRNTMTRLHSEIMRTTGTFRQSGGNAPSVAYLCGGTVALPYLKEFLAEKLAIEVEYFNPLTNVQVRPEASEAAAANAHNMGELIGLALRNSGSDEYLGIDLAPQDILARRDLDNKKPILLAAAALWILMLGFVIFSYKSNTSNAETLQKDIGIEEAQLSKFDRGIKNEEELEKENSAVANPIVAAVQGRTQYIEIFNHLNSLLKNDKIWFVQIEPLFAGEPLKNTDKLGEEDISNSFSKPKQSKKGAPDPNVITHLRLYGMYRESSEHVFNFEKLLEGSDVFVIPEKGAGETRELLEKGDSDYAGRVKWDLALKDPIYTQKAE